MISPFELPIANRVLNDIRKEFMIKESETYIDEVIKVFKMHLWDVLANLQAQYEKEAEFVGKDMEKRYAEDDKNKLNVGYNE